jgi:hypothetical protein
MVAFPKIRDSLMGFLKFSIVLLFILSVGSAGTSFYLSTIRENELEKRLQLESRVEALEETNAVLEQELTSVEFERDELKDALEDRRLDMEDLESEAREYERAFESARKRNQELERILDELEARIYSMKSAQEVSEPAPTYLNVRVIPEEGLDADAYSEESYSDDEYSEDYESPMGAPMEEIERAKPPALETYQPQTVVPTPKQSRSSLLSRFGRKRQATERLWQPVQEPVAQAAKSMALPRATPTSSARLAQAAGPSATQSRTYDASPMRREAIPPPPEPVEAEELEPRQAADQTIAAGHVLLVNRKFNFVVVNLGIRQGLELDDVLMIERDGGQIAKTRIEKIYDDYCAAYIVEEQGDSPIEEGDLVSKA